MVTRPRPRDEEIPLEGLASRVQGGDRRSAEALLSRLLPRVRNLVRYLVRGDGEVDDLAQQSMIAILRGLPTFRGDGSLTAWADRVVVRETLAHVRRRRVERSRREQHARDLEPAPLRANPERYLRRRELAALLDTLPDDQRQALVLHYVLGMSIPEIASQLGIPFDTAKSRLRLGMRKLRQRAPEERP